MTDDARTDNPNKKKAPYRLSGPLGWVHEVALVGAGANMRDWHAVEKNRRTKMADALTLPSTGKQQLLEALGALLEQGVALNDAINAAATTEDANAPMPEPIAETLEALGVAYMQLAEQFSAPAAGPGVEGGEAAGGEGEMQMSAEEKAVVESASVSLAKAIGKRLVKSYRAFKALEGGAGDSAVDKVLKAAGITKAKPAKMTLANFMKLHTSAFMKLFDLVKEIAPFINAMDEEDPGAAAGAAAGSDAEAAKKAAEADAEAKKTAEAEAAKKAAEEAAKSAGGAGAAAKTVKTFAELAANVVNLQQTIEKISKTRVTSNAATDAGAEAAAAAEAEAIAKRVAGRGGNGESKYAPGEDIAARVAKSRERPRSQDVDQGDE